MIQDMSFTADTTSGKEGRELSFALRQMNPDLPVILLAAGAQLEMTRGLYSRREKGCRLREF